MNIHITPKELQSGVASGSINTFMLAHAPDGMHQQFLFLWPGTDGQIAGLLVADDGHPLGFKTVDQVVEYFQAIGVEQASLNYYPGPWSIDDVFPVMH
jgi:hypothetical protein